MVPGVPFPGWNRGVRRGYHAPKGLLKSSLSGAANRAIPFLGNNPFVRSIEGQTTVTPPTRQMQSASEAETLDLGRRLFEVTRTGDVIALVGDLGVGKTVLARGFVRAGAAPGGVKDADFDVPSPTFTLVQVYEAGKCPIWHFDLYRLEDPSELWELGIEEALDDGICLIEWPEKAGTHLPEERLTVDIRHGSNKGERVIILTAGPGWEGRLDHV